MLTRAAFGVSALALLVGFVSSGLMGFLLFVAMILLALGRQEHGEDHELMVMGAVPLLLLGLLLYSFPEAIASGVVGLFSPFQGAEAKLPGIAKWSVYFVALGGLALAAGLVVAVWARASRQGKTLATLGAGGAALVAAILLPLGAAAGSAAGYNDELAAGREAILDPTLRLTLYVAFLAMRLFLAAGLAWAALGSPQQRGEGAHLA